MATIKIKNWKEFQHFKDRSPPWIKLYRENLYRRDIMLLSDRNFKILICFWMLASEDKTQEGRLPEISDIAYTLRYTELEIAQAIKDLRGFLEIDDINLISQGYLFDAPETETEGYSKEVEKKEKKLSKKEVLKPDDVSPQTWDDFILLRKTKKAPVTETVLKTIRSEAAKIGWTIEQAMNEMAARGWQGFKASFIQRENLELKASEQKNARQLTKDQRQIAALDRAEAAIRGVEQSSPRIGLPKF